MKRASKVVLILWAVVATVLCGIFCVISYTVAEETHELESSYNDLQEDYEELESEYIDKSVDTFKDADITQIRGLAYELLFEAVYHQLILKEEYDVVAEIDRVAKQYDLDDDAKTELTLYLQVLIEKYNELPLYE